MFQWVKMLEKTWNYIKYIKCRCNIIELHDTWLYFHPSKNSILKNIGDNYVGMQYKQGVNFEKKYIEMPMTLN